MKRIISVMFIMLSFYATQASAYTVDATLTADNHYGLYYGNANGSSLTLVGRNEFGPKGNPGTYNWSIPESFSFDTGDNNYLYVLAWDDHSTAQSWIGEFNFSGTESGTILSNLTSWKYMVAVGSNPGDYGNLPALGVVQNDIAGAAWAQPLAVAAQGSSPWGTIAGISSDAQFIWHDTFAQSTSSYAHYAIYRAELPVTVTPEPASMLLFGVGGAAMAFRRARQKKA